MNKDEVLLPAEYDDIQDVSLYQGLIAVTLNNLTGFFDITGKKIIDFKYKNAKRSYFKNGIAVVSMDDKQVLINEVGEVLTHKGYDEIKMHFPDSLALVKVKGNDAFGLIDWSGKEVVVPKYDAIEEVYHHIWMVKVAIKVAEEKYKWGIINHKGEQLIACQYDYIDKDISNDITKVVVDELYGIIDTREKTILPIEYKHIIKNGIRQECIYCKKRR